MTTLKQLWIIAVIAIVIWAMTVLGIFFSKKESVSTYTDYEPVSQIQPEYQYETFSINLVGDILAARAVEGTMRKQGYDYPFRKIRTYLADADITFANLETPLIGDRDTGKTTPGGTTVFRGDTDFAQALKDAGIDIVSLANNHMKDQGSAGITSTVLALNEVGMLHVGAGQNLDEARRMQIVTVPSKLAKRDPVTIGFLAYNDADVVPQTYHAKSQQSGTNIMDIEHLKQDVEASRSKVDVLIVSMHSGTEYVDYANDRQQVFARAAIDYGADMVVGHHPHVLQPIEVYKGKYIFYSLGNFVFDQPWPDTKQSVLAHVKLQIKHGPEGRILDFVRPYTIPLTIAQFQPQPIYISTSTAYQDVISRFKFPYRFLTLLNEDVERTILVKVAKTEQERQKGLSGTDMLPVGEGMLFVFDTPGKHGIWMKDMKYPIDIIWFDADFKLVDQRYSVGPDTYPNVFYPTESAVYVLEVPEGALSEMSLTTDLTGVLTDVKDYDKK